MSEVSLSLIPPISKKTTTAIIIAECWVFIALITADAMGVVSYGETRYFHWIISLSPPIWVLLMANPNSQNLSGKDEKRAIMAMVVTFVIVIVVALESILQGNI
ncbi:hypothetical protein RE474_04695 [Methanolobus sediminis]|uniref:Uncharacterized protein n=1 Tax=Methanolobus sediminis TaxID=3072978 RepID=A0AA51YMW8_9EURY|nr:hypothetical protein [Methanolobus sediminis]WMW26023.1 hypothetical protein RE474_04695 [Methanolobus sediminis]